MLPPLEAGKVTVPPAKEGTTLFMKFADLFLLDTELATVEGPTLMTKLAGLDASTESGGWSSEFIDLTIWSRAGSDR